MSKARDCIEATIKGEGLDEEAASELRQTYDDALEAVGTSLPPGAAEGEAGRIVMDALEAKAVRDAQLRGLSVRARRALLESQAAYKTARGYSGVQALGGGGAKPPKDGWIQGGEPPKSGPYKTGGGAADFLKEVIDGNGGLVGSNMPSVKGRYQALMGGYEAMMADLIAAAESATGLPIKGRATFDNIVREAFGEDTGDAAAKAYAQAWEGTSDHARKTFNAAGGGIGKLEKWGLPQTHDPMALRAIGKDGWVARIQPLLDAGKMTDKLTGRPFGEKRLKAVLGDVYDTIVTMGAVDRAPGEGLGKGMLASRRAEARFLAFKDADSWLSYAADFARADPYSTMMRHLDGMARDTARMQVLGPNPDHQFEWLARVAARETAVEQKVPGQARENSLINTDGRIKSAREMYRLFVGDVSGPFGAENLVADFGAGTRAALAGFQLGSAVINDVVSNPVFAAQTRAMAGLSKTPDFKAWASYLTSGRTRAQAKRTGLIFERTRDRHSAAIQRALRAQTVGSKVWAGANAISRLLPNWVNQAAFLEVNRNAQRYAFQAEFMGRLADLADQPLPALLKAPDPEHRAFAALLQARGFTPAEWDRVRATPPHEDGAITPMAVAEAHDDELGWRVAEMIERETRNAVPEPSLWAQAQLSFKTDPGTVQGEIVRSAASYRSFSVTQSYYWVQAFAMKAHRAAAEGEKAGLPWQMIAAMHAAPMLIAATLSGAAVLWLKDMAKGNDPRPLWDESDPAEGRKRAFRFLGMAMAQGGGQGIAGDFLASVEARNGKGMAATAFGPALGFVADTWNLTAGNVNEALAGDETHAGKEAVKYAARYSPLASLWWIRAGFDRAVVDQMQKLIDPEAEADFRRSARRLERELGQGQWWPEGQVLPERAPDLAGVGGGDR